MKKLMYIAATCGIVILAGCASLDDRLASNDPRVRSAAERELLQTSRATGTEADRVAAVKRITDKDYLYEIAMNATTNAWVAEDKSFDPALYDGCSSAGNVRIYYKMTSGAPLYVTVRGKRLDTTKEGVAAVEQLRLDETQKENLVKIFKLIHKAESDQVKLSAFKCVKDSKRIQTAASLLARHATDPKVQAVGLAKLDPEERLAAIARNGSDAKERLEAFNKLKDQKAIDEIALKTNDKAILLAGMSKVSDKAALALRVFGKDFVVDGNAIDLGFALEYLKRVGDSRAEIWSKLAKQGQLQEIETRVARLYHDKHASMSDEDKAVLISAITTPEVIVKMIVTPTKNEIAAEESARSQKRNELEELIEKKEKKVEECEEESENYARYAEKSSGNFRFSDAKKEKKKSKEFKTQAELLKSEIVGLRKKIETLKKPTANPFYIANKEDRELTVRLISSATAYSIATNAIAHQTIEAWNKKDVSQLEFAASLINGIKDEKLLTGALLRLLDTLGEYQQMCITNKNWKWTKADVIQALGVIGKCRTCISDYVREQALMQIGNLYAGLYLIDNVPPELAYRLLVSKKLRFPYLEAAMAKKIDQNKIDINLYDSARHDLVRKALASRAPSSVQPLIQKRREAVVASLLQKAKAQGVATFELKGFYLGMPITDAKKLVEYYLPDAPIEITKDNNLAIDKPEKLFDSTLYWMYFCQADKSGRVYRFNFDKRFLKKWCRYDVQTHEEWAEAFGREHGCDFRYNKVEKNRDMGAILPLTVKQDSYRYLNNLKDYKITYFGKKEVFDPTNGQAADAGDVGFAAGAGGFAGGMPDNFQIQVEAMRLTGQRIGVHSWIEHGFENGDGAKEGTLRVEILRD